MLLAALYHMFGHVPSLGVLINALAGGLTCALIAATTHLLGAPQATRVAAYVVALWPVGFIWGGQLLRESLVGLLLAVAGLGYALFRANRRTLGLATIATAGLPMIWMRGGLAILILGGLPALLVLESLVRRGLSFGSRLLIWVAGLTSAALVLPRLFSSDAEYGNLESAARVSRGLNKGSTSFSSAGIEVGSATPVGAISRLPYVLFGPFPWQITNTQLLIAAVDAALWIAVWYLVYRAVKQSNFDWGLLGPALLSFGLFYYMAISATNFGLLMRLRGLAIPLLAPAVAIGWISLRRRSPDLSDDAASHPAPRAGSKVIH